MTEAAALIFSILIAVVVAFQGALALGAPWGTYAMGGAYPGTYPPKLRAAAIAQGVLLALTALVVLVRADWLLPGWKVLADSAIWPVVGLMAISLILNLITKSRWERYLWAPVTLLLFLCSVIVAVA